MQSETFKVLRADNPPELERWLDIWRRWDTAEVFAHPVFVSLFAQPGEIAACAVLGTEASARIMAPFVIRPVPHATGLLDLVGPYGYGGAFLVGSDAQQHPAGFWDAMASWATADGVVAEFHRMHLFDDETARFPGALVHRSNNVVRDLQLPLEDMWMDFEHKVRKNVKKAQRSGVTVTIHEDPAHHDDFLRIYAATMDRRNAAESYYFSRSFFDVLNTQLRGSYAYAHAWAGGRVISTELILLSGGRAYSFLGGTDSASFDVRPNDLLKYEVMRWAHSRGLKAFVLGGGVSPGDGIERYKAAFAPSGIRPFFTAERVLRADDYNRLVLARQREVGPLQQGYFPLYRAGAAEPDEESR